MLLNNYNSFEEIDNQLEILSLQKQIYKERLKLSLKRSKHSFKIPNLKKELKVLLQEEIIMFLRRYILKK